MNLNVLWASLLLEEMYRQGTRHLCISPGSRSAPLAIAASQDPRFSIQIAYDERVAGFYALGIGRATGRPALLICTSGTAVANYLPAVVEASVDHVPLIICSADRPPELLRTGANQAIEQDHLFGRYTRYFASLPPPSLDIPPQMVLTEAAQAYQRATANEAGPVHLNLAFREPLTPQAQPIPPDYEAPLTRWRQHDRPWTRYTHSASLPHQEDLEEIAASLRSTQRGILIFGRLPAAMNKAPLIAFANALGWPVLADIGSGLRLGGVLHHRIAYADLLLRAPSLHPTDPPESFLQLGDASISKYLLRYIQAHPHALYRLVAPHPSRIDPLHRVDHRIIAAPDLFASALLPFFPRFSSTRFSSTRFSSTRFSGGAAPKPPLGTSRPQTPPVEGEKAFLFKQNEAISEGLAETKEREDQDKPADLSSGSNDQSEEKASTADQGVKGATLPCGGLGATPPNYKEKERICETTESWRQAWNAASQKARETLQPQLDAMPLNEATIALDITRLLPEGHLLFAGNSSPIRDLDLFGADDGKSVPVFANRGASGIDGLLSSALGAISGLGCGGTLAIGDISLLHDLHAQLTLFERQAPLVIVAINNQGGGIFHYLPIAGYPDVFTRFFETPHRFSLTAIAQAIGLSAHRVEDRAEFQRAYRNALQSGKPTLIEAMIPPQTGVNTHKALFASLVTKEIK